MGPLFRPLLVVPIALFAVQCREATLTAPRPITALPRQLTGAENQLVAADNRFAFKLLGEIAARTGPDTNVFISPLSAAMALGMAYNGAAGTTQAEMQRTLELDGMTLDDVNQSYRGLIALLRGLDPQVAFTVANSVWYDDNPAYAPTADFLATTREYFDARVESLDFGSPTAAPTINAWVSDQTRGKIPAIVPDPVPDGVVAYLINAIYFKGSWTTQFDGSRTRPGPFRLANGTAVTVPMMTHGRTVRVGVARADGLIVFDLPYGGGAYSMTIALPQQASGIESLVQGLTGERWSAWIAGLDSGSFEVFLPKFTLTYGLTMNAVLKALGMPSAFCESQRADFTRMNPSGALCITDVMHKAFVDVNEEGTEAAAATAVGIGVTSVPASIVVDRPFVFAIRERLSGTILFLGRVMNPAAS